MSWGSYAALGKVTATWGSRTYPQRYGCDDKGRMETLDTWRNNPPAAEAMRLPEHSGVQRAR
jgi:hypothetical protein